jgi:hypothetical protein
MSAIDFDMVMERLPDPKGDRVKITMSANSCRSNITAPRAMRGLWSEGGVKIATHTTMMRGSQICQN